MTLTKLSGCKINLILNILCKREDGFHELETLMLPVPVHDELHFKTASKGIELTCGSSDLPTGPDNLIWRAADAFFNTSGIDSGIKIELTKNIPTAAGLGGGSGNAATTLLGLNELFDAPLTMQQMTDICSQLGSDIPFFLHNRPSLAFGRGEHVETLDGSPALQGKWLMLINPGFGVSTPWAYKNLARFPDALNGREGRAKALAAQLIDPATPLADLDLYNSLEAPVLEKYPILKILQEHLLKHGAACSMMSGSGATTFALFEDESTAASAKEEVLKEFGDSFWVSITAIS